MLFYNENFNDMLMVLSDKLIIYYYLYWFLVRNRTNDKKVNKQKKNFFLNSQLFSTRTDAIQSNLPKSCLTLTGALFVLF